MTQDSAHFPTISRVIVPVTDQDRAIDFYVGTLGFKKTSDVPFGEGERWVEVTPPSGDTAVALSPPMAGPVGVMTGISLRTTDIDASYAHLRDSGTDVDSEIMRMEPPVPPMYFFRDPDGNTLHVAQDG